MSTISQITSVTAMNLRSLPRRLSTSMVIIIGSAGVVAVLVSVLAMANGMAKTLQGSGRDDRAIILRNGSASESGSALTRAAVQTVMDAPGIKHDLEGKPLLPRNPCVCSSCPSAVTVPRRRVLLVALAHRRPWLAPK